MTTEIKFNHNDIDLTRFWGGPQRGNCIQITTKENTGEYRYITLTAGECADLGEILIDFAKGCEVDAE